MNTKGKPNFEKTDRNMEVYKSYMELGPDGKKKYSTAQLTAMWGMSTTRIFQIINIIKNKYGADILEAPPKEINYDRIDGAE